MAQNEDFPPTYLPQVAKAADRAMQEVMDEDRQIARLLGEEIPTGLRPRRRKQA